jgi:hypothetical protein
MCNCNYPHDEKLLFNAVALTANYETTGATVSETMEIRSNKNFCLLAQYTPGAAETGNVCELEISFSPDGTNWVVYGDWTDGGSGQNTYELQYFNVAQSVNAMITLSHPTALMPMAQYMRVRAKEEGVASNVGSLTVHLYRN